MTILLATIGVGPVAAQDAGGPAGQPMVEITPQLDESIAEGLAFLASQQNADGSFGDGAWGRGVAVTSLAGLAFMADGQMPGRGQYGEVVRRALDYVLERSGESGLLADDQAPSPMYGHGFAALFLGEVYGMSQGSEALQERLHEALVKAVRLIERSQNDEGGWRYNPVPNDADVSVTICQVMALRSARNAGIEVSSEVIDKAVEYVKRCQNPDGGFRYQARNGTSAWPRSAAGVATLYYAG
ncbi:MAG: terpene cyclase/mutase family protein, partial [Pseudomonadales bacterium]